MAKKMRLDKVLAHAGLGTRSEIRSLVKQGVVTVKGSVAKDVGMQVNPYEEGLSVNGKPVVYREFIYIMLHKPQGVVSATEDARDRTVVDLLTDDYRHFSPFPVGRLDKDTEGLLLLTNDGKLAHQLLSPRKQVPKTYFAFVEGTVDESDVDAFERGVSLDDGYMTMPATLRVLAANDLSGEVAEGLSRVELTIVEGKFHQVKRMFQAVGKRVTYLKRISMGPLQLDKLLLPGEYRELTLEELKALTLLFRQNER